MAIDCLRRAIGRPTGCENTGLALSRYLAVRDDEHKSAKEMLRSAADAGIPEAYHRAFERWKALAVERPGRVCFGASALTPIAIGLGNASPLEIGLTTHHTYGVPVIPGSALKGLCRRAAQAMSTADEHERVEKALFGSPESASFLVFWDAWFDPQSKKPFARDVITVHHQDYYSKRGKAAWPTDFDDPVPNGFLVTPVGAKFLFSVDVPEGWEESVRKLLDWGLLNLGIGAKTNAGYGRIGDWSALPRHESRASGPGQTVSGALTANVEVWTNVIVTYDRGKTAISSTQGGRRAVVSGQRARQILDALPEWARTNLQAKKGRIQADVSVEALGNSHAIIEIEPVREG